MKKVLGIAVVIVIMFLGSMSLQAEYSLYWEASTKGTCDLFLWIGEHDTDVKITKTHVDSNTLVPIGTETTVNVFSASEHNYTYNEPCANFTFMYKAYIWVNNAWRPAKKNIYFLKTSDYMNPGTFLCSACAYPDHHDETK